MLLETVDALKIGVNELMSVPLSVGCGLRQGAHQSQLELVMLVLIEAAIRKIESFEKQEGEEQRKETILTK